MALDYPQIIKKVFDSASNALKVNIQSLDMSVELSHADGDSIYTYGPQVAGVATSGTAIDTVGYRKIAIYSVSPVALVLSGSADNTTFIQIDNSNATYILKDIAATQVKLTFSSGTVKYVLQA
jgi:hypothetical protein